MTVQNNRRTDSHTESSEEIRADIEHQRHEMGEKIDAIQDKLSPERLKEQAQETVQSVVNDTSHAVRTYFDEHRDEIGSSMLKAVKQNPIPTALIGLGVGWLLVESLSSSSDDEEYYRRSRYEYGRPRYPATEYEREYAQRYRPSWPSTTYPSADYVTYETRYDEARYEGDEDNGRNVAEKAKDRAADAVQNAASTVSEKGQEMADRITGRTDEARRRAESLGHQTQRQAEQWGHQAQRQAGYMGHQAQHYARQAGHQVQRTIEDNPLTFGVIALAVGAAVGMSLPETRREDRMMGDMSDRVTDAAQHMASDVAQRAQHVAEEAKHEMKEAGQQAMEEVKQSAEHVKDTAQTEAQKAKEDVKNRAEETQKDVQKKAEPQG